MSKPLNEDDGQAVDWILDREGSRFGKQLGGAAYASAANPELHVRVRAVEKILSLLEADVAPEPPANLVRSTMARLNEAFPPAITDANPSASVLDGDPAA
jgi:hypothetical protein